MIPSNITREHIIRAISEIKRGEIPFHRESTKWSILYKGEHFPPKYVISLANRFAGGLELDPSQFSGGDETNNFLRERGFEIVEKDTSSFLTDQTRIWKISPGKNAAYWQDFKDKQIVALGWLEETGDLSKIDDYEMIKKVAKEKGYSQNAIDQAWDFYKNVEVNDLVVAFGRGSIIDIGRVTGNYFFDDSKKASFRDGNSYFHRKSAEWFEIFDRPLKIAKERGYEKLYGSLRWPQDSIHEITDQNAKKAILGYLPSATAYPVPDQSSHTNWWVEKTIVKGRPDKEAGVYSLGKALWSPQEDKRRAKIYENMRLLKTGDVILHLVDNENFIGFSLVDKEVDSSFTCPPNTEWDDGTGKRPGYLVTLKDYRLLKLPINKSEVFLEKYRSQLLEYSAKGEDVFYTKNLELRQGAYLTRIPIGLLQMLGEISRPKTGELLPYTAVGKTTTQLRTLNLQYPIRTELHVAEELQRQICASLNCGSHIIITGPVGTGKTSFAEDVCRAASENQFCNGYVLTTASSDWTTFDTIGGYMPTEEQKLRFEEGKFLEAIRNNKWLIIDEVNRADIDKAFGQLFTILSGQSVELPFKHPTGKSISIQITSEDKSYFDEKTAAYKVGKNWRIIATMNIYDMNFLFEMSYAFMRRFAFVYMDIPADFGKLIEAWCTDRKLSNKTTERLKKLTNLADRKLGPAIIKDVADFLAHRGDGEKELAEAIIAYILPQLEGLEKDRIKKAWNQIALIFDDKTVPNMVIRPILREIVGPRVLEESEPEKVSQ